MSEKEVRRKAIREYYDNEFSFDSMKKVIDTSDFKNREFGFQLLDGKFIRNISFQNLASLKEFFLNKTPIAAYIGAVFDNPPSRKNPIATLNWVRREFVFDLDLDEWDHVRTCGCKGANEMCAICWNLVLIASKFIDETLHEDFGYNTVKWIFSGRRGVHAWVIDEKASYFDVEQRSAIVDYMTVLKGHEQVERALPLPKSTILKRRILNIIVNSWLLNATEEELIKLDISKMKAKKLIKLREGGDSLLKELSTYAKNTKEKDNFFTDAIILLNGPRIDKKVSIDLRRVLRMPGSLHGKSGKRVIFFESLADLLKFDPLVEKSYFQ